MRVWNFGCSFTKYPWPTWADILVHEAKVQGHEGFNLGKCGAGNQFIASRIWECNAKYKFTKDDWVFICWTGFNREDRYVTSNGWITQGNVANSDIFKDEYISTWADVKHYAMRDCMLITSTILGLHKLGVNVVMWSMNPYRQLIDGDSRRRTPEDVVEIVDTYNISFPFPSMMEFMNTVNQNDPSFNKTRLQVTWPPGENIIPEFHPLPAEHLGYLTKYIFSKVTWINDISSSTLDFVNYWEEKIQNLPKPVLLNNENTGWSTSVNINLWN